MTLVLQRQATRLGAIRMSDEAREWKVKWWHKKPLISSVIVGVAFYGWFWMLANRQTPPEGFVFERLPTLSGVYHCCEASGKYSKSTVGGHVVECGGNSYYHIGTGRNDCGLREQLNGAIVEVTQVWQPAYDGPLRLVVKITSGGQTFYELNDKRNRELWISSSNGGSSTLGWFAVLIFNVIQLAYLNRQPKKAKEENP